MPNQLKLLILALDGLDPQLFLRWQRHLPNLARLAQEGIFSPVASTVPAMTFPAWSTFLTGVNPGMHGMFDFTERIPGRLQVRFINGTRRRCPNFLRIASDQGLQVGSIGLPTTYPPELLSGFQISGFDTPLPSKADLSYIYPLELGLKINRRLGGYYFGNFNESRIGRNWHRKVLQELTEGIARKIELVRFLYQEIPLDLLLLHVGETDTVGHHYWSFFDDKSPRFVRSRDVELRQAVLAVYKKTDNLVGDIIDLTHPEAVIVVSDHGMGGTSDRTVYLNQFLAESGFLNFSKPGYRSHTIGFLKQAGMKWIPYRWQQWVFHFWQGRIAANIESIQRFAGINWRETQAYSEELNYFPSIWLNRTDREPFGVVEPTEADRVAAAVEEALLHWKDPESGANIVRKVHRREDLYSGPETIHAPDLILELCNQDNYTYALGRSSMAQGRNSWRKIGSAEYLGYKGHSMNGSHRPFGTMMFWSRQAPSHLPPNLDLRDLAPTALAVLGAPIPAWMEGRSLISGSDYGEDYPLESGQEKMYSTIEEKRLRERLSQMGYLG